MARPKRTPVSQETPVLDAVGLPAAQLTNTFDVQPPQEPAKPLAWPAPVEIEPQPAESVAPAEWKYDAPSADPLPPLEIESLPDYLARIEHAAQPLPVCEVTHPDAADGTVHTGTFAGIRLVCGFPIQALLSDGSTI